MKFLLFVLVCLILKVQGQDVPVKIDTAKIKSEILKEERALLVMKSEVIIPGDSITLIYLLNDQFAEYRYRELLKHFTELQENTIAITIENKDRKKDMLYSMEAEKFLDFLEKECFPKEPDSFPVKNRILYGHSIDGSFSLFAMHGKPGLFDLYIASSPVPIMDLIDTNRFYKLDSILDKPVSLYFSHGTKDMRQVRKRVPGLNEILTASKFNHINWRYEVFEDANHQRSDIKALMAALFYFKVHSQLVPHK